MVTATKKSPIEMGARHIFTISEADCRAIRQKAEQLAGRARSPQFAREMRGASLLLHAFEVDQRRPPGKVPIGMNWRQIVRLCSVGCIPPAIALRIGVQLSVNE